MSEPAFDHKVTRAPWLRAKVASAAVVYLIATALARAGAIVLIPLYTRKLSLASFGDYALAQTIVMISGNVLSLGTVAAVGRFYFDGHDLGSARVKAGSAASFSMLLTLANGAVVQGLILTFASPKSGVFGSWELTCILWASVGSFMASIPTTYLRSAQRPLAASVLQLYQFIVGVTAGLVQVALLRRGLRGSIEALGITGVVTGLTGLVYVWVALPGRATLAIGREAIRFSLPFVPHLAAVNLGAAADRWVLKGTGREAELGSYALANQLAAPAQIVLQAWNEAESPRVGELCRTGGMAAIAHDWKRIHGSYVLVSACAGALTLLGLPLLRFVVGARFAHALWPLPFLLGIFVVESLYFPPVNILYFARRTGVLPIITTVASLVNAGANLLLVPIGGIWGAIGARALSMTLRSGLMLAAARRSIVHPESASPPTASAAPAPPA